MPSDPPLRRLEVGGLVYAYTDLDLDLGGGDAPVVLALHGLPGSHRDFRWLGAAVAGRVRLVRVDLPGFGETSGVAPSRWAEIVASVRGFAEAVIGGPHAVLGHSFGAPLATMVAAAGRGHAVAPVTGLAWLAPVGLRPHRVVRRVPPLPMIAALARVPVAGRIVLHAWRAGLRASGFPARTSLADVGRTLEVLGAFRFAMHAEALRALRVPVLAAWTQDDAFVEPEVVRELCACAPGGPRLGFQAGGHNLQKTRASEIGDALVGFARGVRGGLG